MWEFLNLNVQAIEDISGTARDVRLSTLPKLHAVLDATAGMLVATPWIITLAVIVYCVIYASHKKKLLRRKLNRDYLRIHYGDDIATMTLTYTSLIKFLSGRVYEALVNRDDMVEDTKVILVGAHQEVEGCIWDRRTCDQDLQGLLFPGRRFIFSSIAEAMKAVDEYCSTFSASSNPESKRHLKTLFVFILISSQDPSISGPQCHQPFRVPSSLKDHYAIIGTGFHVVAAHKLSSSSIGADGDPLETTLPMGTKEAGVTF